LLTDEKGSLAQTKYPQCEIHMEAVIQYFCIRLRGAIPTSFVMEPSACVHPRTARLDVGQLISTHGVSRALLFVCLETSGFLKVRAVSG